MNFSINYRLEPGGCSAGGVTAVVHQRDPGGDPGRADRGGVAPQPTPPTYGVDATRIAVAGTSAGAITAAQVGYLTSETPAAGGARRGVAVGREHLQHR